MTTHTASIHTRSALRLATAFAAAVVSAVLMFGHGAWAPTDVYVEGSLSAVPWDTASAHRYGEPLGTTMVYYWTSSASGWPAKADGSPAAGTPCSWTALSSSGVTRRVIHAVGSSRVCY